MRAGLLLFLSPRRIPWDVAEGEPSQGVEVDTSLTHKHVRNSSPSALGRHQSSGVSASTSGVSSGPGEAEDSVRGKHISCTQTCFELCLSLGSRWSSVFGGGGGGGSLSSGEDQDPVRGKHVSYTQAFAHTSTFSEVTHSLTFYKSMKITCVCAKFTRHSFPVTNAYELAIEPTASVVHLL